jgi:predicted MPP superfamily phosphohydrolase
MFLDKLTEKLTGLLFKLILVLIIVVLIWMQNHYIVTRSYIYSSNELPKNFVGYKILHISDICNTSNNVVSAAKKADPDIIVITGGYEDTKGGYASTVKIVNKLTTIAPVYYIYNTTDKVECLAGTEAVNLVNNSVKLTTSVTDAESFIKKAYGKNIIKKAKKGDEDALEYIQYISDTLAEYGNQTITLCGIGNLDGLTSEQIEDTLYGLTGKDRTDYIVALDNTLTNVDELVKYNFDVILAGGTFGVSSESTSYTKGIYGLTGAQLFVSGGCGNYNSKRIFNLPEVQLITLSDGTIRDNNPLEEFLSNVIGDVGTIYDNDGGFKEYTHTYKNGEEN